MGKVPVPLIRSEADYKAIRAIPILDIPDTFDMWSYERSKDTQQTLGAGHIEMPIEVDASKIKTFCARTGQAANFQAIKDFVLEEFGRQQKAKAKG